MASFLCSRSIHRWEHSQERYYIPNDHGRDNFLLRIRSCKRCKIRQVYTMIYPLQNSKKFWKNWDKGEGDSITWEDLS